VWPNTNNSNGVITQAGSTTTLTSATLTALTAPVGSAITVTDSTHTVNSGTWTVLTSPGGSVTYINAVGVATASGVVFGVNLTALLLFQNRQASSSTITVESFPARDYDFVSQTLAAFQSNTGPYNYGPYARRIYCPLSSVGGTIYVDTALETNIPVAITGGETIEGFFSRFYQGAAAPVDLRVVM
jgi:hypothetical protein